jgi:hypothetical protein
MFLSMIVVFMLILVSLLQNWFLASLVSSEYFNDHSSHARAEFGTTYLTKCAAWIHLYYALEAC